MAALPAYATPLTRACRTPLWWPPLPEWCLGRTTRCSRRVGRRDARRRSGGPDLSWPILADTGATRLITLGRGFEIHPPNLDLCDLGWCL